MTLFQLITELVFVCICIFITYQNQRKYLAVLKQRDQLGNELFDLINKIGWVYPEGLHPDGEEIVSAKKLLRTIVVPPKKMPRQ